eukprot:1180503-Prorocentrum_minimum.AAC.2
MRATNRTTATENIPRGRPIERRRLRIFHAGDADENDRVAYVHCPTRAPSKHAKSLVPFPSKRDVER